MGLCAGASHPCRCSLLEAQWSRHPVLTSSRQGKLLLTLMELYMGAGRIKDDNLSCGPLAGETVHPLGRYELYHLYFSATSLQGPSLSRCAPLDLRDACSRETVAGVTEELSCSCYSWSQGKGFSSPWTSYCWRTSGSQRACRIPGVQFLLSRVG